MPWTTPQIRPVGYVIKKAEDWDVIVNDLQYLKDVLDGVQTQIITFGSALRVYPSGGVYVGSNPVDPGANNLQVGSALLLGSNPPSSGAIRLSNNTFITARRNDGTDIQAFGLLTNDNLYLSSPASITIDFSATTGNRFLQLRRIVTDAIGLFVRLINLPYNAGWDIGLPASSTDLQFVAIGNAIVGQWERMTGLLRVGTDLLPVHRHPYSNNRHIEAGQVVVPTVNAGSIASVNVTFTDAFASTPRVIPGLQVVQGVRNGQSVCTFADPVSTTGCSVGISNDNGVAITNAQVSWIAEGPD